MALTTQTNGSSGPNIIKASWFNDFKDLLTGVMQDQEVTIKNNLTLQAFGTTPVSAPTAAAVSGTGLGIGVYSYVYTYINNSGETLQSPAGSVTTTTGNQKVNLSAVTVGPTGTTARKVYRTAVGGSTYKLLTTINDNTTTTYVDTTADASLGTSTPANAPSLGGSLILKDSLGTTKFRLNGDGSIQNGGFVQNFSGTSTGSGTCWMDTVGNIKRAALFFTNYKNGASTVIIPFPAIFATGAIIFTSDAPGFNLKLGPSGANLTLDIQSSIGASNTGTTVSNWQTASANTTFDRIIIAANNASAHTGWAIIIGN